MVSCDGTQFDTDEYLDRLSLKQDEDLEVIFHCNDVIVTLSLEQEAYLIDIINSTKTVRLFKGISKQYFMVYFKNK